MTFASFPLMSKATSPTIGIDFGGTSIKLGVVSGSQVIAHSPSIASQDYDSPEALVDGLAQFVKMLIKDYPEVNAIGMGMPGFVNYYKGTVHSLANLQGWNDVPIRDLLQQHCQLPVCIENDANCTTYAEWKFGAGVGKKILLCLTLGTGVGSGIIINEQLLRGVTCSAGELGQTSIDYKGRRGHYENRGALETYIGNRELAADARVLYAASEQDKAIADCNPIALEKAALQGDPIAIKVWTDLAHKLACALINCCYLLNPDTIIIGGGVAKAKDLLFVPLKQCMKEQLPAPLMEGLEIIPAKFGTEAGIIGAAALARDTFFPEQ
ncbi:MAG: ROK family protein [Akkermansia sp.]